MDFQADDSTVGESLYHGDGIINCGKDLSFAQVHRHRLRASMDVTLGMNSNVMYYEWRERTNVSKNTAVKSDKLLCTHNLFAHQQVLKRLKP